MADGPAAREGSVLYIILIAGVATIGGFLFGFDSGVINGTVDGLQAAFDSDAAGTGFNVASMLLGCAVGAFFAGQLADRWGRATKAGYALTPAVALTLGLPCLVGSVWVDDLALAMVLIGLYLVAIGFYLGPSFSVAQTLAPVSIRATSTAIFFFVLNMIGLGAGPSTVGFISTALSDSYNQTEALRLAMITAAGFGVIAIGCFLWAAGTLPRDWAAAEARNSDSG